MKKLIALFIALALCLGVASAAMAEQTDVTSVSWIEVAGEAARHDGCFYTLNQVGLKLWVSDALALTELDQDQLDRGYLARFESDDQNNILVITLVDSGSTYEDFYSLVLEKGMEGAMAVINDLPAIVYRYVRSDGSSSNCVAFVTDAGSILEFVFTGEDSEFLEESIFSMCSIQPEDAVERPVYNWEDSEEALMEAGVDGSFYMLFDADMLVWIPDFLEPVELTDEDRAADFIAYYASEDGTNYLGVTLSELGVDYDQGLALLEESGAENITEAIINSLPIVIYTMPDDSGLDHTAAMVFTGDGCGVNFVFSAGDEEFDDFIGFILASIQMDR